MASERAREAFLDDDFSRAVSLYSQAIELDPANSDLFFERSQAHIKLGKFFDAVSDAGKAIELNPLMAKAYLRKGSACMKLGDYETAKATLELGSSIVPDDSRFAELLDECKKHIQEGQNTKEQEIKVAAAVKPKFRHEFYQTPEVIVVTIFAKGIQAKDLSVDYGEQILSASIDIPGEESYTLQTRLYGKIVPRKCRYRILKTKIEIRLAKAEQIHWKSLEYIKEAVVTQPVNVSSVVSHRPVYPSSKNRRADWDKLEAEVKKEEKEEKLDGDAGVNKLFQDIFQSADEDTRRAMTKSFYESNGTVLSTSWEEVGAKKIEGSPPDGMELKKWEY